jgi:hypothetical protein
LLEQQAPGGKLPGVFLSSCRKRFAMWPAMAQKQRLVVRYYLWADDGPWRLPVRLHQDLIDRKVAFPQYAGTKQKILEVFARWITRDTFSLKGRGSIDTFDADGFMERERAEELVGWVVERAKQKLAGGNVMSIEPTLRERRYKREHLWKPTASMLRLIEADFQKVSRATGVRRVRVLKRPT